MMTLTKNAIATAPLSFVALVVAALTCLPAKGNIGAEGRGGGGGICINGKCMTLAEAGLKLQEPPITGGVSVPTPAIPADTIKLFDANNTKLSILYETHFFPSGNHSSYYINNYKPVIVYDPIALKVIKDQYSDILKQNNFPNSNLEIFAISSADTTYLLPEFYKLNKQSQMLVMFHEELMKAYLSQRQTVYSPAEALDKILRFDSGLLKFVQNDFSGSYEMADALVTLKNFSTYTYLQATILMKSKGEKYIKIPLALGESLFLGTHILPAYNSDVTYDDIEMWNAVNLILPELAAVFRATQIQIIKTYSFIQETKWSEKNKKTAESLCAKHIDKNGQREHAYFLTTYLRVYPDIPIDEARRLYDTTLAVVKCTSEAEIKAFAISKRIYLLE